MQTAIILRTERLLADTGVFTRWTRRQIGRDGVHRQLMQQLSRQFPTDQPFVAKRIPVCGPLTYTQHLISLQPRGDYMDLREARRQCYAELLERSRRVLLMRRIHDTQVAATIDGFLPWTHEWMFLVFAPGLFGMERIVCMCQDDFNEPADAILHASTHICCFPHGFGYASCDCWRTRLHSLPFPARF